MTTSTATLRYSSSRAQDARDAMARVAAARRVTADRRAREAREAAGMARNVAQAQAWVDTLTAAGAVEVGVKVCLADGGKWRVVLDTDGAAGSLARWIADGDGIEAWGRAADGAHVGEVLGVW